MTRSNHVPSFCLDLSVSRSLAESVVRAFYVV
jgi:hypothetical protein